jgi:signal transduction histidine kinase
MPGGGTLLMSCAGGVREQTPYVIISFKDTGPGLGSEAEERLFEPYFSTKTTGTGLGLAICRTLSREMGGDVLVENIEDNQGVEATVFLKMG